MSFWESIMMYIQNLPRHQQSVFYTLVCLGVPLIASVIKVVFVCKAFDFICGNRKKER